MNRCYQIIWSKTRFARVVVSELARTRGKKGGTARKDLVKSGQALLLSLSLAGLGANVALAEPANIVLINGGVVETGGNYVQVSEDRKIFNVQNSADFSNNHFSSNTTWNSPSAGTLTAILKSDETLNVSNAVFDNNRVTAGPGVVGNPKAGGINVSGGSVNLSNVKITSNSSYSEDLMGSTNGTYGGALGVTGSKTVLNNVTISNTTAGSNMQVQGAGFYQSCGTLYADGLHVNNNTASQDRNASVAGTGVSLWGITSGMIINSSFDNNTGILLETDKPAKGEEDTHDVLGGGIHIRNSPWNTSEKNVITITNSSISGNSINSAAAADVIKDSEWDTARGGGLYVKSDDASHPLSVTLNDVSFNNNTATSSTGKNVNAYAYGGAVMNRYADLTFNISQDMSYTGNSVHGENAKGGFLYLESTGSMAAKATFNVATGKTLTVGNDPLSLETKNDSTDSIAGTANSWLVKTGGGNMIVNGQLDKYEGNVQIDGGLLALKNVNSTLTIGSGSSLLVNNGKLDVSAGHLAVSTDAAKFEVGKLGAITARYDDFSEVTKKVDKTLDNNGVLSLSGDFSGSLMSLTDYQNKISALQNVSGHGSVQLAGVTIQVQQDTPVKLDDLSGIHATEVQATASAGSDNTVDLNTGKNTGVAALQVENAATDRDLKLNTKNSVLTLAGSNSGGQLVTGKDGAEVNTVITDSVVLGDVTGDAGKKTNGTLNGSVSGSVAVANGEFNVTQGIEAGAGNEVNVGGNAALNTSTVKLNGTAQMGVTGTLTTQNLVASADTMIAVGSGVSAGKLVVDQADLKGASIVLDPVWTGTGADTIMNASHLALNSFAGNGDINGLITVGQNSLAVLGDTTVDNAIVSFNKSVYQWGGNAGQVSAALALWKPFTLDKDFGGITVDGAAVSNQAVKGEVTFANNSLFMVNGSELKQNSPILSAGSGGGTFNLGTNAGDKVNFLVSGGQSGTYQVIGDFTLNENGELITKSDTALLTAKSDIVGNDWTVTLTQNNAELAFPLLKSSTANMINRMVAVMGADVDSANAGVKFISRATSDSFVGSNDIRLAAATIDGAARLNATAAIADTLYSVSTANTNAIYDRFSGANDQVRASYKDANGQWRQEKTGMLADGASVWFTPLYLYNDVSGMKAGNFSNSYQSSLGGMILGGDYTVTGKDNAKWRSGAAVSVGTGDVKSRGDFNKTKNDVDFWGIRLYSGWTKDNLSVIGSLGYSRSKNDITQELPSSMQMGSLSADTHASAWDVGVKGEYRFETPNVDVIPYAGVHYTHLKTNGFDVTNAGQTVFNMESDTQNIWSFPLGVAFEKNLKSQNGWMVKPKASVGIIAAAGDLKARSVARIPGLDAASSLSTEVVDSITFAGGLGISASKGNATFGLTYGIQASENRTGQAAAVSFRYKF